MEALLFGGLLLCFNMNVTILHMKKCLNILLVLFTIYIFPFSVFATEEIVERFKARVVEVNKVDCEEGFVLEEYECVKYKILLLEGESKGEEFETGLSMYSDEQSLFDENAKVYVSQSEDLDGNLNWRIENYSREAGLFVLISIFILLTILVNGKQGWGATAGLVVTVLTIYGLTIPLIINGVGIFWVGSLTVTILLLSSYLSHGFNKKTTISLISMFTGAIIVFVFGYFAMKALHLTGIGEETSNMLYEQLSGEVNLFSILLFSIVLGAAGVLDDVTIGQVSSMQELLATNPNLSVTELYKKSMNIGRDHIASMINTLFIAYAGSSLTLVIVLAINNPSLGVLMNMDFIVEEIVRTIVPSIGLIVVVPLTSFIASSLLKRK